MQPHTRMSAPAATYPPERLVCGGLPYAGAHALSPDELATLRRIVRRDRRCLLADYVALALATMFTFFATVGFAVYALDVDGKHPPAALALSIFALATLASTGVFGVINLLVFPQTRTDAIAAVSMLTIIALAVCVAIAIDTPGLGTVAAVPGIVVVWAGIRRLRNALAPDLTRARLAAALADLDAGIAWRFTGLGVPREAEHEDEATDADPSARDAPSVPVHTCIDVLPMSAVHLHAEGLWVAPLRPIAPPCSPYRGRGSAASARRVAIRCLIAAERWELADVLRRARWSLALRVLFSTWTLGLAACMAFVHALDLGATGLLLSAASAIGMTALILRERAAACGRLRRDHAAAEVVTLTEPDPLPEQPREWLRHSARTWT